MSIVGLVASILVGLVFVAAGGSKLAAGPGWPASAKEMGAPAVTIPFVPWVELAVGATLIAQLATPVPAILAMLLLVAFTVLIVVRLSGDDSPSCACFGSWSAEPIGRVHVIRNLVLIGLAILAMWA